MQKLVESKALYRAVIAPILTLEDFWPAEQSPPGDFSKKNAGRTTLLTLGGGGRDGVLKPVWRNWN